MRSTTTTTPLVSLKSGQADVVDTNENILGRDVVDLNGEGIGKVDDVFVDLDQRHARFISVKSGDVLGMGGKTLLIPVDAIQSDRTETVVINAARDRIETGPELRANDDEATTLDAASAPIAQVYDYYGISEPFWSPTYRRPNWS
jgi:sporulation protein YlmC with PRC-barrel domain